MGIMRWTLYEKLKEQYPNVKTTYGYITKNTRVHNELPKEHRIDALCITLKSESKTIESLVLHQKDKKAQPPNT